MTQSLLLFRRPKKLELLDQGIHELFPQTFPQLELLLQGLKPVDHGLFPIPILQGENPEDHGLLPIPIVQGEKLEDHGLVPIPIPQGLKPDDHGLPPILQGEKPELNGIPPQNGAELLVLEFSPQAVVAANEPARSKLK